MSKKVNPELEALWDWEDSHHPFFGHGHPPMLKRREITGSIQGDLGSSSTLSESSDETVGEPPFIIRELNVFAARSETAQFREIEERFETALEQAGVRPLVEIYGSASLASHVAPEARSKMLSLRTFLLSTVGALTGIASASALHQILQETGFSPIARGEFALSTEPDVWVEPEWGDIEHCLDKAVLTQDYQALERLTAEAQSPFTRDFIRMISNRSKGYIGDAYAYFYKSEQTGLFQKAPAEMLPYIHRFGALVCSLAGKPEASLRLHQKLADDDRLRNATDIQKVKYWREHLNFWLQCLATPDAYFDPGGSAVVPFDDILKKCLSYTGVTLAKAIRFDQVVGPAVICMKAQRDFIRTYMTDRSAAREALDLQRSAIKEIAGSDPRLAAARLSPLIGQHIRAANWNTALELLDEQKSIWKHLEPARNNPLEYGVHEVLYGIVKGIGFSSTESSLKHLDLARAALGRTMTNRFQSDIAHIVTRVLMVAEGEQADVVKTSIRHCRRLGKPTGYYLFGT